jgi:anti-sigma-K factor RskA
VIGYLPRMGHAPFQYPTPEGYSDKAAPWMGTLLWRWKFAVALSGNAIAGTRIAVRKEDFGGEDGLMAHLLGRRPQGSEAGSFRTSGNGLALLLASPGFQRR